MKDILKRLSFKMEIANILQNFVTLIFIVNLVGCLLALSATVDIDSGEGWILNANL
jgi:hypothetical protein